MATTEHLIIFLVVCTNIFARVGIIIIINSKRHSLNALLVFTVMLLIYFFLCYILEKFTEYLSLFTHSLHA